MIDVLHERPDGVELRQWSAVGLVPAVGASLLVAPFVGAWATALLLPALLSVRHVRVEPTGVTRTDRVCGVTVRHRTWGPGGRFVPHEGWDFPTDGVAYQAGAEEHVVCDGGATLAAALDRAASRAWR
ncbi:MAG TPA: hypothetical protein PKA64_12020 [Myxococcota bacterium]|nr:hypothetical protein [Myxococcota bacterium]